MNFMKIVKAVVLAAALLPQGVMASSGGTPIPHQNWPFKGVFGKFDDAALKRGAQVAVGVCLGCHAIKYIKFDAVRQFGFTEAEVKALAESQGRNKKDPMLAAMDDTTAKDSFGVVPPDLSLITKARKGYEDYTYAILTGYLSAAEQELVTQVLADGNLDEGEVLKVASALHLNPRHPEAMRATLDRIANGESFNKYFPGNFLAMPQPMSDGMVEYTDGTENSLRQMSHDLVTFLAWAAEPTLMERKSLGIKVILYLFIFTIMLYALKRRIWARIDH